MIQFAFWFRVRGLEPLKDGFDRVKIELFGRFCHPKTYATARSIRQEKVGLAESSDNSRDGLPNVFQFALDRAAHLVLNIRPQRWDLNMSRIIGYTADALIIDPRAGTLRLRSDYDVMRDRLNFDFTDQEERIDDEGVAEELDSETNQIATLTTMDGARLTSGRVRDAHYYTLSNGSYIECLEIAGVAVGYLLLGALSPGVVQNITDTNDPTYSSYMALTTSIDVASFGPATTISTLDGDIPVEWLAVGDLVITRDHGAQPIRRIKRVKHSYTEVVANPMLWPVTVGRDEIAPDCPNHPLVLTRHQKLLLTDPVNEFLFGHSEVFATSEHLFTSDAHHAPTQDVTFYQLLLEEHEIILANGLWVESHAEHDASQGPASSVNTRPQQSLGLARPTLCKREISVLKSHRRGANHQRRRAA